MSRENLPEVWLRGPLPSVPALLQPAAHALLQAREELHAFLVAMPPELIWQRPVGLASVAFHLQHLAGVLDRLLTYAREEQLTAAQLDYLKAEGIENSTLSKEQLLHAFDAAVDAAIAQMERTDPATLTEVRGVGRQQLPSTVIGLLFHAAEHTMRHTGQLLVTARVLIGGITGVE
ncbi:MAG: DinB family protein [Candidatus Pseudobacter hemicellulosilyticus]|uniref:DinB family protein n=1 Tax=Candidatus Pseudobacter hemicellulosilyticus TaxID=3121375 RepID=A0AAJ5WN24_9BACT|nr:MAG: DinB family protein [Pseudobacter sp.]